MTATIHYLSERRAAAIRLGTQAHERHDRCMRCKRVIPPKSRLAVDPSTGQMWCSVGCWALDKGLVES